MKNLFRLLGIIAIAAMITFAYISCEGPVGPAGTNGTNGTNGTSAPGAVLTSQKGITLLWIPAGTFRMGSPGTEYGRGTYETQHKVTLTRGFYMGKYQVTQELWEEVMTGNTNGISPSPSSFGASPAAGEVQELRPVEYIRWYEVLVFCNRLSIAEGLTPAYKISGSTNPDSWGTAPTSNNETWNAVVMESGANGYRLPTEAQWEYACRAGTTGAFNVSGYSWGGSAYTFAIDPGWFTPNSSGMTHQVGMKTANAWGLCDMHGNVYEWCWDWYDVNFGSANAADDATDPMGGGSSVSRIARGGSWSNSTLAARSAYRGYAPPNNQYNITGFRLVRP